MRLCWMAYDGSRTELMVYATMCLVHICHVDVGSFDVHRFSPSLVCNLQASKFLVSPTCLFPKLSCSRPVDSPIPRSPRLFEIPSSLFFCFMVAMKQREEWKILPGILTEKEDPVNLDFLDRYCSAELSTRYISSSNSNSQNATTVYDSTTNISRHFCKLNLLSSCHEFLSHKSNNHKVLGPPLPADPSCANTQAANTSAAQQATQHTWTTSKKLRSAK